MKQEITAPSIEAGEAPITENVKGSKRRKNFLRIAFDWLAAIVLGFIVLFPVLWMIKSSFQPLKDLLSYPPIWIPKSLYLNNYISVLQDSSVLNALKNSLIVASISTLTAVVVGAFAAYAFVRFKFKGKNALFVGVLMTQMLPGIALVIPLYIMVRRLGLQGTYFSLILAYISFTLPYTIWLLRAYLTNAPWELEDQARIDGCSRIGALVRVVFPTILPGLITASIFAFINTWNEYLFALILSSPETKTFPIRLAEYINQERIALEEMFAAGVIAIIPVLLLIVFLGRYIISGLSQGALKG